MKFHDTAKRNLFRFIGGISGERDLMQTKSYILSMKSYPSYSSYFHDIVKSIRSESEDWDTEMKYSRIRTDLAIVAGLYYGDDISLKHLERDYKPDLSRDQLRQEVITFTSHILFGVEVSKVEKVGDLRIEKEGLVPIMDRIIASGASEQEQKNELMRHLRVYGILSERAMQEAREAADRDPDVILARNTFQNKQKSADAAILPPTSFVEMVGGKRGGEGRSVHFS